MGNRPKFVRSWKVGRVPFSSPSKIPDFTSLGDTAVDFDFATPTLRKPEKFIGKDINKVRLYDAKCRLGIYCSLNRRLFSGERCRLESNRMAYSGSPWKRGGAHCSWKHFTRCVCNYAFLSLKFMLIDTKSYVIL